MAERMTPIPPPAGQQCGDCYFYRTRDVGGLTIGECRYYPAKLHPGGHAGQWPQVFDGDWCGNWKTAT